MKTVFSLLLLLSFHVDAQQFSAKQYREDVEYFLTNIENNYAYWDKKQTDWSKVRAIYLNATDTVSSKGSFIALLEKLFYEIYDHHASLNTNTAESQRLVPSGTDIWAEYKNGIPVITQLRSGSNAYASGLRTGMQVIAFNDVPVERAISTFLPRSLKKTDPAAKNYALRILLAGKHNGKRLIRVRYNNKELVIDAGKPFIHQGELPLSDSLLKNNIALIRFNDRLWDNNTIAFFDSVLQKYKNTNGLILDMRNTASGGNTTVARAIIGSFITKEGFYQKHELVSEEKETGIKRSWVEVVSPRKYVYSKPLFILVDHWTGSVGEGIVVGFDAVKRGTIIGTEMAGLHGANYSFNLPNTGIGFSFPSEKLFHVNGTPRENFRPHVIVKMKSDGDAILEEALKRIRISQ